MANKIQVRRGAIANLPTLSLGEPALTTDTNRLFIGGNGGNVELATVAWAKDSFSNRNLLINTNFKNAVNQRGQSSYSVPNVGNYVNTIDRWKMVRANLSVSSEGVALNRYSGIDYGSFNTVLEENYNANTITLSCKVNGNIYCGTGVINTTIGNNTDVLDGMHVNLPFGYVRAYVTAETGGNTIVEFITISDTAYTIEWVKLELGSVATPFVPRPYVEELQDCMMYDGENLTTPYSNPNLLINGDFKVWQRGTSFTALSSESVKKYTADRWSIITNHIGNAVGKVTINGENYYKQTFTDCANGSGVNVEQLLEANGTYSNLSGKTITFSAEAKCTSNCRCIYIAYVVGGVTGYKTTTIDNSNVFKRYSVTATIPENATLVSVGLGMSVTLGSSFNGTETVFGKCKLELGSVATSFVPKPYVEELQDCLMYDGENLTTPYSNPNLLINTNFKTAVNQRGQTSYSVPTAAKYVYTIDRWKMVKANLSVSSAGIALWRYSGTDYGSFNTVLEENCNGNIVTLSCKVNGTIYRGTGSISTALGNIFVSLPFGYVRAYVTAETGGYTVVEFITTSDTKYTIEWVKLELGSVATPFVPRPYGEELTLCQRYYCSTPFYNVLGSAGVPSNNTAYLLCHLAFPVEMRTIPTVKVMSVSGTENAVSDWASVTNVAESVGHVFANAPNLTVKGISAVFTNNTSTKFSTSSTIAYYFYAIADAEIY